MLAIGTVPEDGLTAVAPVQHMIDRPRILHSEFSGHDPERAELGSVCQYQDPFKNLFTDPYTGKWPSLP